MGQTAIPRNALSQCQAGTRFRSSPVGYPWDKTAPAASPAALPFCRTSCLAQTMNTEKAPQLCPSPGSCQGSLLTQPLKIPPIARAPLAGLWFFRHKRQTTGNNSQHSIFTFRTEPLYMGTFILTEICTFKSHMLSPLTELEHWITTAWSV